MRPPLDLSMASRQFIQDFIGAPYENDGRTTSGIDCWGLVVRYYSHVLEETIPDWRRGDNSRSWVARLMTGGMQQDMAWLDEPVEHCIAVGQGQRAAHHAGIFTNGGILHASRTHGVVWRNRSVAEIEFGGNLRYGVPRWMS